VERLPNPQSGVLVCYGWSAPAWDFRIHAAQIEGLGSGDLVKVDCAACGLTPEILSRLGLDLRTKMLLPQYFIS
jgi:hypothetical protein